MLCTSAPKSVYTLYCARHISLCNAQMHIFMIKNTRSKPTKCTFKRTIDTAFNLNNLFLTHDCLVNEIGICSDVKTSAEMPEENEDCGEEWLEPMSLGLWLTMCSPRGVALFTKELRLIHNVCFITLFIDKCTLCFNFYQ